MSDLVQKMRGEFEAWLDKSGGGTLEAAFAAGYDARQSAGQERGEAVALHREAVRVAAVAAIRRATKCPDLIGYDGKPLSEALMDELDGMFYAAPTDAQSRIAELEARIANLELEAQLETCIREKMGEILTQTANILKGAPAVLTVHSWHDLAEVAAALEAQLTESREREGRMREAIGHYDKALLAACPEGAQGAVHEHWNEARKAAIAADKSNGE